MSRLTDSDFGKFREFNPKTRGKLLEYVGFRGKATSVNSYSEMSVSTTHNAIASSVQSNTTYGIKFFLVDGNIEKDFNLKDCPAIREGNDITVVWGILKGDTTGEYLMVINHTTNRKVLLSGGFENIRRAIVGIRYALLAIFSFVAVWPISIKISGPHKFDEFAATNTLVIGTFLFFAFTIRGIVRSLSINRAFKKNLDGLMAQVS